MGVRYLKIPELTVGGKRLGRHVFHDEASKQFAAEKADPTQLVSVTHKAVGLPLDQGQIGSCTANALCGAANSQPNHKAGAKVYHEPDAVKLYGVETTEEGEPYPPNDPGGSGLQVCKAAQSLGWITSYTHAFGIEHALLALVLRPVITGVSWYASFDSPDSTGLVSIAKGSNIRGGHEFVVPELIVPKGATIDDLDDIIVEPTNSWGKVYGLGGKFRMTAATWSELLAQQGDVTVPIV